ncbi:MAG: rhomboid family intramembrane serine protease [Deltaproteobacteria bacterium]
MFPIRDHNPSTRTPYVTWALIAVNIAIYLMMLPAFGDEARLAAIYDDFALVPVRVTNGQAQYTVLTSMFLHGGFWHIAGNMLFLWIFGDNLEDQMGHALYLAFYLTCGVGADLAHLAVAPNSPIPTIGASGAIAGVMGGYLLLFPRAKVDVLLFIVIYVRVFSLPAFGMLGIWFGLQVLRGIGDTGLEGGVAYMAHVGGFVVGFLLCLPLWMKRGGQRYWQQTDGHPPHPAATFRLQRTSVPRVKRR